MTEVIDKGYASLARELADTLMIYARGRRDDDKKHIAQLQTMLCKMRRDEVLQASNGEET